MTWILDDLTRAREVALRNASKHDVYVACGMGPQAAERASRTRLKAHEIVGIPGVWADIDVNGGPDAKDGAAPSLDAAVELSSELLEPSLLVKSGYGLQAWWLWEDGPWMFPARADAEQAKRIVTGYQGALRAAARRLGWGLDATQDLARVMRLPGTFNHKGSEPVPVELVEASGRRYAIEEVGELGQGFLVAKEAQNDALESGEGVQIEIRKEVALDHRVMELRDDEPEFAAMWDMKKGTGRKRRDWSASEFEFSICNWLVRAGLTHQQLADALVYWRNKIEPGDPRRKVRRERIAATISKVISTVDVEDRVDMIETTQDRAVKVLEAIGHGIEEPNEAKTMGAFNRIIGGPEIARLRQYSRDPETARFVIELADGSQVSIGTFDCIASQALFRKAYGVITGHYPASVAQKKWDTAVAGLLKAAVVLDEDEDTRRGQMRDRLLTYIESASSNDWNGACEMQAPFVREDGTYVALEHFAKWLRRALNERTTQTDVAMTLRMLGFGRKTVSYVRTDGRKSSRSYFVMAGLLGEPTL